MSKEILAVVEVVSNEKGVAKEIIFEALEAALAIEALPPNDRLRGTLALVDLARFEGRFDDARAGLSAIPAAHTLAPDVARYRVTLQAALAQLGDDPGELAAAAEELEEWFTGFLADWKELELRPGGFGFFVFHDNRRVLSELIRMRHRALS